KIGDPRSLHGEAEAQLRQQLPTSFAPNTRVEDDRIARARLHRARRAKRHRPTAPRDGARYRRLDPEPGRHTCPIHVLAELDHDRARAPRLADGTVMGEAKAHPVAAENGD